MHGNHVSGSASMDPHRLSGPVMPGATVGDDGELDLPAASSLPPVEPASGRRRGEIEPDELLEEIEHLTAELKRLVGVYASLCSRASNGATADTAAHMDQILEKMAAKALEIHVVARHAFLRTRWQRGQSARVGDFNGDFELGKAQ